MGQGGEIGYGLDEPLYYGGYDDGSGEIHFRSGPTAAGNGFGIVSQRTAGKLSPRLSVMSAENSPVQSSGDLVRNSSLYREFQAEREEILKHKWIESEKAGYDIGFERALTDWIVNHRAKWRRTRQPAENR